MIKLSKEANELIDYSKMIALNLGHSFIGTEHLILAFFSKNSTRNIFLREFPLMSDILYSDILNQVLELRGRGEVGKLNMGNLSRNLQGVIEKSYIIAFSSKSKEIEAIHLAKALAKNIEFSYSSLIGKISGNSSEANDAKPKQSRDTLKSSIALTPTLNKFSKDLTECALDDNLDPVIGREKEISRVMQILLRKNKNNPCLIGNPGVGKSAIAEGLAQKIVQGDVPDVLSDKRIVLLDISSVVAGAKYRGDFEERIKNIFNEVKKAGNVILFIDEIHNLVNTGGGEGTIDAANIIKPELARGEISIIGATTFNEYKKYIEKDGALDRRLQRVHINEPTAEETVTILKGLRERYEKFHNVEITDDAIETAVKISSNEILGKYLPDKAIDLIDESAAMLKIKSLHTLSQNEIYEALMTVNDGRSLNLIKNNINVPQLINTLKKAVIGQDDAVEKAVDAIVFSSSDVGACMLFCGPTGCGKTTLAKEISKAVFNNNSILKIDMSEFAESHTISRLIGSPPGYVGYDDSGILIEAMIENPTRMILFDEIEKAHPDVRKILLSLLDDGILRDVKGRDISFKNAVIVMTSSLGYENEYKKSGFLLSDSNSTDLEIRKEFGRELFARIDNIIEFKRPTYEDAVQMCKKCISNLNLSVERDVIDFVIERCDVGGLGLRNVEKEFIRLIKGKVEKYIRNNKAIVSPRVYLENSEICISENFDKDNLENHQIRVYNTGVIHLERKCIDV